MEKQFVCQGCNESLAAGSVRTWQSKGNVFCFICHNKVYREFMRDEYEAGEEMEAMYAVFPHLNPKADGRGRNPGVAGFVDDKPKVRKKASKKVDTSKVTCPACRDSVRMVDMVNMNGVDFQICSLCHTRAVNVWRDNEDKYLWQTVVGQHPHLAAYLPKDEGACNLGDINLREHMTKDEPSLFAVGALPKSNCVHTDKLNDERYKALEYDDNEFEELDLGRGMETVKDLESLMDAALLGKDIEWAKELHEQIRMAKESIR